MVGMSGLSWEPQLHLGQTCYAAVEVVGGAPEWLGSFLFLVPSETNFLAPLRRGFLLVSCPCAILRSEDS